MTFYGDHITEPTLAMIEIYVAEKGYYVDAEKIFNVYSKRNWLSNKGNAFSSIEQLVDNANKVYELKQIRRQKHKQLVEKDRARRKNIKRRKTPTDKQKEYGKLLEKKEWKEFRLVVLKTRGEKCEMCGARKYLQIHHPKYIAGRKPWEYSVNEVAVLCGRCHRLVHNL